MKTVKHYECGFIGGRLDTDASGETGWGRGAANNPALLVVFNTNAG